MLQGVSARPLDIGRGAQGIPKGQHTEGPWGCWRDLPRPRGLSRLGWQDQADPNGYEVWAQRFSKQLHMQPVAQSILVLWPS